MLTRLPAVSQQCSTNLWPCRVSERVPSILLYARVATLVLLLTESCMHHSSCASDDTYSSFTCIYTGRCDAVLGRTICARDC